MAFNRAQVFAALAMGLLLMAYGAEAVGFCYCRSRLYSGGCTDTDSEHCAKACRQEHISDGFCDDRVYARGLVGPRCICAGQCDAPPPPVDHVREVPPIECGVSN